MIFPPMGFFSFPAYGPAAASGFDMTWLVTTTAIPNYSSIIDNSIIFNSMDRRMKGDEPHPQDAAVFARTCPSDSVATTAPHDH